MTSSWEFIIIERLNTPTNRTRSHITMEVWPTVSTEIIPGLSGLRQQLLSTLFLMPTRTNWENKILLQQSHISLSFLHFNFLQLKKSNNYMQSIKQCTQFITVLTLTIFSLSFVCSCFVSPIMFCRQICCMKLHLWEIGLCWHVVLDPCCGITANSMLLY